MVRTFLLCSLITTLVWLWPEAGHAKVEIGKPAPSFLAADIYDQPFTLSDHKGKIVVLEWTNHLCPCVTKHYSAGHMQAIQKAATENGVVWVSIVSAAPYSMGAVSAEEARQIVKEQNIRETTRILDPDGRIGKLYNATTTPHMYVIDTEGNLAYTGALDDSDSYDPETIETAHNYVEAALSELQEGKPVSTPVTPPFGCPIMYKDEFPEWGTPTHTSTLKSDQH